MSNEFEKQEKIEKELVGIWMDEEPDYLWQFLGKTDDGSNLLIISDERKHPPGTYNIPYNIIYNNDESIILELWFSTGVNQCQMKLLGDNLLELQTPPVGNVGNVQRASVILRKA